MPIYIADTFEPASGNNTFPVVSDVNVKNGYKVVADIASRDAIDPRLITAGAVVGVLDSNGSGLFAEYRFLGGDPTDDTTWILINKVPSILWKLDGSGDATTWAEVVALIAMYPVAPPGIIVIDNPGNYPIDDLGSPAELNYWSILFSNPPSLLRKAIIASTAKINNLGGISGGGHLTNVALASACLAWDNLNYRFFIRDHAETNTIGGVAMVDASTATGSGSFNCVVDTFGHVNNRLVDSGIDGAIDIMMLSGASANNGFAGTAAATLVVTHDGSTATFEGATSPYGSFAGVVTNDPSTQMGGRGTTSHRPNTGSIVAGTTYYDEDTGHYIVWDGASWTVIV